MEVVEGHYAQFMHNESVGRECFSATVVKLLSFALIVC